MAPIDQEQRTSEPATDGGETGGTNADATPNVPRLLYFQANVNDAGEIEGTVFHGTPSWHSTRK